MNCHIGPYQDLVASAIGHQFVMLFCVGSTFGHSGIRAPEYWVVTHGLKLSYS
jgi:hypothetical protein